MITTPLARLLTYLVVSLALLQTVAADGSVIYTLTAKLKLLGWGI